MTRRDIFSSDFEFLSTRQYTTESDQTFIGVDECLNGKKIHSLLTALLEKGLASAVGPLWQQKRIRDDGSRLTLVRMLPYDFARTRDSRNPQLDYGTPAKHQSFSDAQVVRLLVWHLERFDRVILLTNNIRQDANGLRMLLSQQVMPKLSASDHKLSLVGLFKKGKTNTDNYCSEVEKFLERGQFGYGYTQILI
jgi:hypothetical protein